VLLQIGKNRPPGEIKIILGSYTQSQQTIVYSHEKGEPTEQGAPFNQNELLSLKYSISYDDEKQSKAIETSNAQPIQPVENIDVDVQTDEHSLTPTIFYDQDNKDEWVLNL
jgi:hypothetical protein